MQKISHLYIGFKREIDNRYDLNQLCKNDYIIDKTALSIMEYKYGI